MLADIIEDFMTWLFLAAEELVDEDRPTNVATMIAPTSECSMLSRQTRIIRRAYL